MLVELLVMRQHAAEEIVDPLRLDDRQQRMLRAERVPQRERAVVLESFVRMNLAIQSAIAAVGVVEQDRREAGMIERGIERAANGRIGRLDLHLAEHVVPLLGRSLARGLEIHRRNLGGQILAGGLDAYGRDADLHQHRLRRILEIELSDEPFAVRFLRIILHGLAIDFEAVGIERARKFGDEEEGLVGRPTVAVAIAADQRVGFDGDLAFDRIARDAATEIEEQMRRLVAGERIAMETGMRRGGHFRLDFRIGERHAIIAGRGLFILMRKLLRKTVLFLFGNIAADRLNANIAQVGAAGAA